MSESEQPKRKTDPLATFSLLLAIVFEVLPLEADFLAVMVHFGHLVEAVAVKVGVASVILAPSIVSYMRIKERPNELRGMRRLVAAWIIAGISTVFFLWLLVGTLLSGQHIG